MRSIEKHWVTVLFLLAAFLIHFFQIGNLSIYILDEAKNATAAFEMWESSNWILPTFNSLPRYDKPPLHYYFFGLAYQFFGVSPFAARFFPALMGWLTLCLVYFNVEKRFGRLAAVVAGMALLSSIHWVLQFHLAVPDPFLIFFITSSLIFFSQYWEGNHKKKTNLRWMGLVLGLAILSKGPIALVLVGGTIVLFLLFQKGKFWDDLKGILDPLALSILILVALPWYFMIAWETEGVWVQEFFFKHNLSRFAAPMEGHGGGFYLTLLFVMFGLMPGSLLIIGSIKSLIAYSQTPTLVKISLLFSFLTIVFFMISGTKLPNYTAPVYPFMAIIIGWLLKDVDSWERVKWPGIGGLLLLLTLPFLVYVGLTNEKEYVEQAYVGWYFLLGSFIGLVSLFFYFRGEWKEYWLTVCLGFVSNSLIFLFLAFPVLDKQNPVLASQVSTYRELDFYHFKAFNPSYVFAVQKEIKSLEHISSGQVAGGIVILRKNNLKEFEELGYPYEVIFEGRDLFENPITVLVKIKAIPKITQ